MFIAVVKGDSLECINCFMVIAKYEVIYSIIFIL